MTLPLKWGDSPKKAALRLCACDTKACRAVLRIVLVIRLSVAAAAAVVPVIVRMALLLAILRLRMRFLLRLLLPAALGVLLLCILILLIGHVCLRFSAHRGDLWLCIDTFVCGGKCRKKPKHPAVHSFHRWE